MKYYYVYIISNKPKGVFYFVVTGSLEKRVHEHKGGVTEGFSKRYNTKKLVYFEQTTDVEAALRREKQIKNWHRDWKINLIESVNPIWEDLSEKLFNADSETSSE